MDEGSAGAVVPSLVGRVDGLVVASVDVPGAFEVVISPEPPAGSGARPLSAEELAAVAERVLVRVLVGFLPPAGCAVSAAGRVVWVRVEDASVDGGARRVVWDEVASVGVAVPPAVVGEVPSWPLVVEGLVDRRVRMLERFGDGEVAAVLSVASEGVSLRIVGQVAEQSVREAVRGGWRERARAAAAVAEGLAFEWAAYGRGVPRRWLPAAQGVCTSTLVGALVGDQVVRQVGLGQALAAVGPVEVVAFASEAHDRSLADPVVARWWAEVGPDPERWLGRLEPVSGEVAVLAFQGSAFAARRWVRTDPVRLAAAAGVGDDVAVGAVGAFGLLAAAFDAAASGFPAAPVLAAVAAVA